MVNSTVVRKEVDRLEDLTNAARSRKAAGFKHIKVITNSLGGNIEHLVKIDDYIESLETMRGVLIDHIT